MQTVVVRESVFFGQGTGTSDNAIARRLGGRDLRSARVLGMAETVRRDGAVRGICGLDVVLTDRFDIGVSCLLVVLRRER